jgi:ADP-heptose:LPS heptosyltransferase
VKRWPVERYGALAVALAERGMTPVVIGGEAERESGEALVRLCPQALDLCGRTDFAEVSSLARGAAIVIGNDTGPLHLAALSGAPVVALFSRESHPVKARPAGPLATVLQRDSLADLPAAEVLEAVERTLRSG